METFRRENYAEVGPAIEQQIEFYDGILERMLLSYIFYCNSFTVLGQPVEFEEEKE